MFSKYVQYSKYSSIFQEINGFTQYSNVAVAKNVVTGELEKIKAAGTWKKERIILSKQSPNIRVEGSSKHILNLCANNYLGLSSHPEVIKAAKNALDSHGAGLSSVRFICGTMDLHKKLEKKISEFHSREDTILYTSCFDANAGIFEVLLTDADAVISDELNHASIIDGIRLCKAKRLRYKNADMADLERILSKEACDSRIKMIVTDGVFSMDGRVAPLNKICDLAEKYNAIVFVDECHSTGFFGETGRGTEEYLKIDPSRIHIINSTLGKALGGSSGGYTTGPRWLIDLLRQRSRPYLFSNSIPPSIVASSIRVFELLTEAMGENLPQKLQENTIRFRNAIKEAGFKLASDDIHPICPIMLGDAKLATIFADKMLDEGIYVIGFSYPVVPVGKARIRVQLSAAHQPQEIDRAIDAFVKIGKELKVIP